MEKPRQNPIPVRFPETITKPMIVRRAKKLKINVNAYIVGLVKTDLNIR